ncbi:MAG TPA: hypothetical protein VMU73_05535 [Gaiellaceae bacterium]|nr:hypothetical protein [Gaiellaceae bacterium]
METGIGGSASTIRELLAVVEALTRRETARYTVGGRPGGGFGAA